MEALLDHLSGLGVRLWVEEDRLRYRAPAGAMDGALAEAVRVRKPELLAYLRAHAVDSVQGATRPGSPPGRIPARTSVGRVHLSLDQEGLWFLHCLAPKDARYNIGAGFRLRGGLDVSAPERSIQEVVRRHESLRTALVSEDGEPVQRVQAVPVMRMGIDEPADPDDPVAVQAWLADQLERPFELADGHLLRVRLLRLRQDEHVLAIGMHPVSYTHLTLPTICSV